MDHRLHYIDLALPYGAVKGDCLTVDIAGGDDVFIEDDEVPHATAGERFDAVGAPTATAEHEHGGCSELVECGAPHDDFELGVARFCDRGAVWHV